MKKTIITGYYLVLATVVTVQAITTVFEMSATIGYGKQIAALQKQKSVLSKEIGQSSQLLAQKQSITSANQLFTDEFVVISQPIVINTQQTVAAR
ncbi:MAG: hypothetical protein ACOZAN_04645 [Patescibacteria group bacterium]